MNIQDAYTRWSTTYDQDRNRTRDLDARTTREVLAPLRCRAIVELGCGTGKNTAFLAELGTHVHALDFSEGMIARAREKVGTQNVTFTVATLTERWPCEDQSAELLVCNLVLEHIRDLGFIFAEATRVLAAGGRFFVCELHPCRQYGGTQANFQHDGETIAIPAFQHHISEFTDAAAAHGLALRSLKEWWHEEDEGEPPRLVSFLFEKEAL